MRSFFCAVSITALLLFGGLVGGLGAQAAGPSLNLPTAPVQYDKETLQRGAAAFVNYCLGCHSAQYLRYGRMAEDLDIDPQQIKDYLIHNGAGLGDGMHTSMSAEDGREWFYQAAPPDLSLASKLRRNGNDWLYAYLHGFYRDPSRPSGWNNAIFNNVAMPHVLADLQGTYRKEGDDLVLAKAGRMSAAEYNGLVIDIVSFMAYAADPSRQTRLQTGYLVMAFLLMLVLATYFLYREYWRDIK